jgi:glycosyltransferase involved in cell wall biosynthesis
MSLRLRTAGVPPAPFGGRHLAPVWLGVPRGAPQRSRADGPVRKRILVLIPSSLEHSTTRYRFLQYLPALRDAGFDVDIRPFLTPDQERRLYSRGFNPRKLLDLVSAGLTRLAGSLRPSSYDAVIIAREAMLYGPPVVEWWLGRVWRRPLVFDFDDAVWVAYDSPTYGTIARWVKCAWKTPYIIRMSAHVLAASPNLVQYARSLHADVTWMPTVVDVGVYDQTTPWPRADPRPVIGWVGSHSTAQYLEIVAPALEELSQRHAFVFRVVGARRRVAITGVEVDNREWRADDEIRNFRSLDIGLYPIRDDQWSRGKAAFKAIQYMAAGVPCVASPVGMSCDVVEHGVTGLLARTTSEWVTAIHSLLTDRPLVARLTEAGKARVRERYSLAATSGRMIKVLVRVTSAAPNWSRPG